MISPNIENIRIAANLSDRMKQSRKKSSPSTMARQIAQAIRAYEIRTEGHPPQSVNVILSGCTLVIVLEGALSSVEQSLLQSPAGAAQVQDFHEQLFWKPGGSLWHEIRRIIGIDAGDQGSEGQSARICVKIFPNGTVVHVFLLDRPVATSSWNGSWAPQPSVKMVG
jgi:uncharacterized protein YbcI